MSRGRLSSTILPVGVLAVALSQSCFADQGLGKTKTVPVPELAADAALGELILQSFAPITGGETYDSDDTYFMDVNLSLKIRLSPASLLPRIRPFVSMSTRFGFYWGSRPNSPVIGKSYNPELFFRILGPKAETIEGPDLHFEYRQFFIVGYAHESNGQLIHTQKQYQQQLLATPPASYADNFVHRGWDYLDVAWKQTWHKGTQEVTSYFEGKYFLPTGLLQGQADEYHSWENNPQGKPRRAVDGIEETVDWPSTYAHFVKECDPGKALCRPNLTLKYLTGYQDPFRYNTIRGEFGFQLFTLPLAIWVQHGYMSSLANYYKDVTSVGIEVRFESF